MVVQKLLGLERILCFSPSLSQKFKRLWSCMKQWAEEGHGDSTGSSKTLLNEHQLPNNLLRLRNSYHPEIYSLLHSER